MADAGADGSGAAGPGDGMKVSERKKQKELDQQRKRQALELLSDDTYDIIVRQFNRVLQNLSAQEGMDKFRAEYEILYKALTRAHESEVRLLAKCADLNGEIAANATKVESAIQMSLNDQEVIENLKKELETAHLLVDDAKEKEIRARATTISIRQSFKSLVKIIEGNANALPENNAMELMRMKEELAEQLEARTLELGDVKSQFELLNARHDALEKYYNEAQNKIRQLEVEIETRDNEGQREQRKREKLDRELRQAKSEIESKNQENRNLRSTIENLNRDNANQEYQIKEIKQTLEKQQREMNQIQEMNRKIQSEFNNQEGLCANLMGDNHAKTMEIKLREDEINGLRNEIQKYEKNKFTLNRKIRAMEDQRMQMEKSRETMRTEMGTMEKALEATRKQAASDKKEIDELIKLRDTSRKSIVKQQEEQESIMQYVLMHEMTIKKLEKEMTEAKEKDQENDKLIYRLQSEKADKQRQMQKLANKIMKVQQEAHEMGLNRMDLQRRIEDWEKKHKELNSRYEQVRNERNANGKSLFETRDEVLELKKQMSITEHQIDQLREQNSFKDASLSKERLENQRMAQDAETLKVEIMGIKNKLNEAEAEVRFHEQREQRMMRDLDKIENEIMLEKKKTEKVEDERDILGTQLLRRNDELGLLYEKIKCLQAAMNMGEAAYNTRLEDIRILKVEIKKLRCSKIFMEKGLGTLEDMRRELYHQHQETLQIRNRCKALEDELENPMNVHRWRKLEGSDPSLLEIILKVQGMQKKLILKTEEVLRKEQIIKEKDQLFEELSRVLARRAAPEMAEELSACRKTIRNQSNRIKGLTAEVRMHETIAAEMKFKNECLNRDLMKVNDEHKLLKEHVERIDDKDCHIEQIAFGPFPILNPPVLKPPPAPPLACRSVNSQRNVRTAAQ